MTTDAAALSDADAQTGQVSEDDAEAGQQNQTGDDDGGDDDPVASLTERLTRTEGMLARLSQENARLSSAVGRVPNLVRDLQALAAKNPTAEIQPRIDGIADLIDAVIDNLDAVAFREGGSTTVAQRREALRRKVELEQVQKDLEQKYRPPQAQQQDDPADDSQPSVEMMVAQQRLIAYAEAKGVDPAGIPDTETQFRPGETVAQAEARLRAVINTMSENAATAQGTARRRQAAGAGAPSRGGTPTNDEALLTRWGNGETLTADERHRVEQALMKAGAL